MCLKNRIIYDEVYLILSNQQYSDMLHAEQHI